MVPLGKSGETHHDGLARDTHGERADEERESTRMLNEKTRTS
jgi:hypothetical protein